MLKKNKIIYTLFVLLCFAFNIKYIFAETKCKFANNNLIITYNEDGKPIISQNFYDEFKFKNWLFINFNINEGSIGYTTEGLKYQEEDLQGMCPENVYICEYEEVAVESGFANLISSNHGRINVLKQLYLFYGKSEMEKNSDLANLPNGEVVVGSEYLDSVTEGYEACQVGVPGLDQIFGAVCGIGKLVYTSGKSIVWSADAFYGKYKNCQSYDYSGDLLTFNLACPGVAAQEIRFNNGIQAYNSCNKNDAKCKLDAVSMMNKSEDKIKSYCSSVLANYDYDGDNEQSCIEFCLDVGNKLLKSRERVGIISKDSNECGFSGRLVSWLMNIVKWVKYIAPILVIILGIIDFIKAIVADKDDEMKKAQGRFVRRLIAAALLFLVPLIIEFVITKFGFDYTSCGLF